MMRFSPARPAKFLVVPAILALLSLSAPTVWADTISFNLDSGNSAISGFPAPYATVTVNRTSTTTATITFDAITNATYQYLLGDGGTVAVNVNGSFTLGTITGTQPLNFGPTTFSNGGSGNEDGWGNFNLTINSTDGYTDGSSQVVFNLTLTSGTWATASDVLTANASGQKAAAHIFVCASTTCDPAVSALNTGFAAGNGQNVPTPPPDVGVPEPTSMLLLGTGLIAVARRFRRS